MSIHQTKHNWRRRLVREYGAPWRDVLNGFIDQGCSVREISAVTGVGRFALRNAGYVGNPPKKVM